MKTPLLKVSNLTIGFEEPVVSAVSFELEPGACLGIVGESGSGKSLTSLAIMGLLPKSGRVMGGQIWYHNKGGSSVSLTDLPMDAHPYRGVEMGMIFQEPMSALNPSLTCGFQVAEPLMHHFGKSEEAARQEVLAVFRQVDLPRPEQLYDAYPHQLSGGQRQRVVIAMALICNPRLLIADEPTTALDVTVQQDILKLLKRLQTERQMGLIFISHDLGVVRHVADQVLVLYRGEVVEQGPANQILKHPQADYTKGLLACRPSLTKRPVRLATVADYLSGSPENFEEKPRRRTTPGEPPLLQVKGLNKWYQSSPGLFSMSSGTRYHALKDVGFDLFPGESLGLVGESGSGKSTLGRCIVRLITPEAGTLFFRGEDITHLSGKALAAYRRKVQIIFQDPFSSLNPRIRVGVAIAEPMIVHRLVSGRSAAYTRARALLEQVGLPATAFEKFPHQFSGGQRQRIGIARALALQPQLIVCDESVSALDVSVQAQILNLLNDLKEAHGFSYLFISHDLAVVKYMSDRLLVMQHGEIVEQGPADRVYAQPTTPYTAKLISSILE
jgi:peptide/nickel transport system ATP-binding protein